MDEVTNQEQETIQSLPIQQGKPSKKKLSIWIFLSIFFLITTLILSYFLINQKQEVNNEEVVKEVAEEVPAEVETGVIENKEIVLTPEPTVAPTITNTLGRLGFDVTKIQSGDIIEGMKVSSISPFFSEDNHSGLAVIPFGNDNFKIDLEGEISLEGIFHYSKSMIEFGGEALDLRFYSKDNPNLNFDDEVRVSNLEIAKKLLKIDENEEEKTGKIKVTISEYSLITYPIGGVISTGKLVKVLKIYDN